ncbi:MAG: N-acetyltransferase family protein [Alphaproteobacteria bacterium]
MIRLATTADAPAIAEIFLAARRASMAYLPALHTDDETRAWIAGPMMTACEVWVGGSPIRGFLALDEGRIDHLYVAPEAQGRGLGSALLRHVQARRDRLSLFVFERNRGAIRLYRRHGFRTVERRDGGANEEREPDRVMAWAADALERAAATS